MAMNGLSRWTLGLMVFAAVGAAGVGGGAWLFSPVTPDQLQASTVEQLSPVAPKQVDDARSVELSFKMEKPTPLRSATGGLVTSTMCAAGSKLTSGTSAISVNGSPIISLSTRVPLWRQLEEGSKGDDALALQEELARLGYSVKADGEIGTYTIGLVAKLLGLTAAEAKEYTVIDPASFLWLPAPEVTVSTCTVGVGTAIEAAAELFSLNDALTNAHVEELPTGLIAGERILKIGETQIAIGDDGNVTDQQALTDLQQTSEFILWRAGQESGNPVNARFILANPVTVYAVAPASVYSLTGTSGGVRTDNEAMPVTIVSSELGQTLVSFDNGGTIPDAVQLSPTEELSCR